MADDPAASEGDLAARPQRARQPRDLRGPSPAESSSAPPLRLSGGETRTGGRDKGFDPGRRHGGGDRPPCTATPGLEAARDLVERLWAPETGRIEDARPKDSKTRLQEWGAVPWAAPLPAYAVVDRRGRRPRAGLHRRGLRAGPGARPRRRSLPSRRREDRRRGAPDAGGRGVSEPAGDTPTRAGFAAVIGAPNAGKSTLVNRLVGQKVSIVTQKVQTTRFPVRGVALEGQAQVVLVDTPGVFKPRRRLDPRHGPRRLGGRRRRRRRGPPGGRRVRTGGPADRGAEAQPAGHGRHPRGPAGGRDQGHPGAQQDRPRACGAAPGACRSGLFATGRLRRGVHGLSPTTARAWAT